MDTVRRQYLRRPVTFSKCSSALCLCLGLHVCSPHRINDCFFSNASPSESFIYNTMLSRTIPSTWVPFLVMIRSVQGHGQHEAIPEGSLISDDPIDAILWIHIFMMIVAFGKNSSLPFQKYSCILTSFRNNISHWNGP